MVLVWRRRGSEQLEIQSPEAVSCTHRGQAQEQGWFWGVLPGLELVCSGSVRLVFGNSERLELEVENMLNLYSC